MGDAGVRLSLTQELGFAVQGLFWGWDRGLEKSGGKKKEMKMNKMKWKKMNKKSEFGDLGLGMEWVKMRKIGILGFGTGDENDRNQGLGFGIGHGMGENEENWGLGAWPRVFLRENSQFFP